MLTYLWLNIAFLAVVIGWSLYIWPAPQIKAWSNVVLALILLSLTTIFDMILTSLPIVTYQANRILGLRIGSIPIEDYAYTLAALVIIPMLWQRLHRHQVDHE